ncbi:MAG TPA: L-histidine N(alpha)-methyltransferase [Solirubrobacteraceae bacterium]
MPGIFISHAAADAVVMDEFVDSVVKLGCGVPTDLIFYSSGADTGVPSGTDLNAYVRERVSEVGLVVSMLTPAFQTRPFCVAELGAAWSRVDNLFPLKHPELDHDDLDGVLKGMLVRSFDDEVALDELHERICKTAETKVTARTWTKYKDKWLEELPSLLSALPTPAPAGPSSGSSGIAVAGPGSKRWGQLFDSFVDAALYTGDDTLARAEIVEHAEAKTLVPSRYLYTGDWGAHGWVRLCKEGAYRHYRDTRRFWRSDRGQAMACVIRDQLGREDFDYLSLGSGNGEKDAALVSHWLKVGCDIFYYPYDISLPLVSQAHKAVYAKKHLGGGERLRIKTVLADFNHLGAVSEVFTYRTSPNVIALLGNSLGNIADEISFLERLKEHMSSEDLLVLEVRLKSSEELRELASVQAMKFDFGPLEHYLGMSFDMNLMRASERLPDLSDIDGTVTTVIGCEHEKYEEIKLSYIHEYEEHSFVHALSHQAGFEVLASTLGEKDDFLVCVARPKPEVATT